MPELFYRIIYNAHVNYALRNINRFFKSIIPSVKIPPSGRLTLRLKSHRTLKFYTNQTDYVGFLVFWNGLYEYEYIDIFEDLIKQCDGFIDIGSNAGLYSLIAGASPGPKMVIAFDPTDAAFYYMKKNIDANHMEGIIFPYQIALSNKQDYISFYAVKNRKYGYLKHNLGGASSFINKPTDYKEIRVESTSLDFFIHKNYPDMKIDFIKIDAEGAEPLIINGMGQILHKHQPILVCEVLFGDILENIEQELRSFNYAFYFHVKGGLKLVNSLVEKSNFEDIRNCFLVPSGKISLISKWILD